MGTLRDISQQHTFINTVECEVWCMCGNQYTVFPEIYGVVHAAFQCSECGRIVVIQASCVFDDTPHPENVRK